VRAADGGPPRLATRVALLDDGARLRARFDCDDPEPWATIAARDGDLWTEEVVELFVAAGARTAARYYELELNPLGTVFDAAVDCPHGDRRNLRADRAWSCEGLETAVARRSGGWTAELSLPWSSISPDRPPPNEWRINLFRIERRPGPESEHSAWSPTGVSPADFHRPARFGFLSRVG
jgi:hypothetical protein